jgi:hypothetical protein
MAKGARRQSFGQVVNDSSPDRRRVEDAKLCNSGIDAGEFVNAANHDYRLKSGSGLVGPVVEPGSPGGRARSNTGDSSLGLGSPGPSVGSRIGQQNRCLRSLFQLGASGERLAS